jgi:hypothetical protein
MAKVTKTLHTMILSLRSSARCRPCDNQQFIAYLIHPFYLRLT